MKNAAGDINCDEYLKEELEASQIPYEELELFKGSNGEVPSALVGFLEGWKFRRAWYYWVASSSETVLLFENADRLYESHGDSVRVSGHAGSPSPRENLNKPWHIGVNLYHVDTQEGLNALAKAIVEQSNK